VSVQRVYDAPQPDQGARVLVDRIWPRGLRKDAAHLDEWARDVAPSTELRTWYGHDPAKFAEFRRRYIAELAQPETSAALGRLRARAATGPVTLLTATKDVGHSQAAVLAGLLSGLLSAEPAGPSTATDDGSDLGDDDSDLGGDDDSDLGGDDASDLGGDMACWAHLVCPECGAVTSEGHRPGCGSGPAAPR
jgi:uncharacterized protein YeaO (DUF488 family)